MVNLKKDSELFISNEDANGGDETFNDDEKISDEIYKNIAGNFTIRQTKDDIDFKFKISTPEDIYIVRQIFEHNKYIQIDKLAGFATLYVYKDVPFAGNIRNEFEKLVRERNENIRIRREEQQQNNARPAKIIKKPAERKFEDINQKKYSMRLGEMILRKVIYKDLSKYKISNYEIKEDGNCVTEFLKTKKGISKALKTCTGEWTTFKLIDFANKAGFNVIQRNIDYEIIHETIQEDPRFVIDYVAYNNHMYILSKKPEPIRNTQVEYDEAMTVEKAIQIGKTSNGKRIIVTDRQMFKDIKSKIRETDILIDYNDDEINYKNNRIEYFPDYNKNVENLNQLNSDIGIKSKSINKSIDNLLKLRGYVSLNVQDVLTKIRKIRIFKVHQDVQATLTIDKNCAYPSQLFRNIAFPIPLLSDKFVKYDGEYVQEHGLYYIKLNKYDNILAPHDGYYFGLIVHKLMDEKRVSEILYSYITEKTTTLDVDETGTKLNGIEVEKHLLTNYIGWLRKTINEKKKKYDLTDSVTDRETLRSKYSDYQVKISDTKPVAEVTRIFLRIQTGILSNILVMDLTNLDLYLMDKQIKKLNPGILLNRVKTDALSYIHGERIKLPKGCINELKRGFKILEDTRQYYDDVEDYPLKALCADTIQTINNHKLKVMKIKSSDDSSNLIEHLIENNKSFQVTGKGGYGKSYLMKHKIIKYMKTNKIDYFCTSSTIENSMENSQKLNETVTTINSIIKNLSMYELTKKFRNKYIIVDESSQLTQQIYKTLEYLKQSAGTKIILIGDANQCKSMDAYTRTWIVTDYVNNLCDNYVFELQKHENIRYDEETDSLLDEIIKADALLPIRNKIKEQLKHTTKMTDINLSYTNRVKDYIITKGYSCSTTHSAQGKTIETQYTVHEIRTMPKEVMYTALSRCKSIKNVFYCETYDKCGFKNFESDDESDDEEINE